ncbi:MAG: ribulose-phosphate 3-epimerase [Candidatus Limiplasma sp.]|nr:ribulose-phosphate 3-epimerase [Candidatus Limiplasma sp.]
MTKIAPSILAADTMHMGDAARRIVSAGCDYVHFDVMDGVFVPNLSFGPALLKDMKAEVALYFDVHLMLIDPLKYVDVFADAGASGVTVHVEAEHFPESLARIRSRGLRTGASLRPATPAAELRDFLPELDLVLVMTVEPGFGGQTLNPAMLDKIRALRGLGFAGEIEVDGGVTLDNAPALVEAGADTLVMGTTFFRAADPQELTRRVHQLKH